MEYREIAPGELDRALFRHFERRQEVTKCRRRENGVWVVRDAPFIDDWSEADYAFLVQCLQNTGHGRRCAGALRTARSRALARWKAPRWAKRDY
ncbi:MAG: hypothetical protein ACLR7U_01315 [Ruthenibacterium lactatiformans]